MPGSFEGRTAIWEGTSENTLGLCSRPMRGAALRDTRLGAKAVCFVRR